MQANPNDESTIPTWLTWARQLQSISQAGLHFAGNDFDRDRFTRISSIAAEIMANFTTIKASKWQEGFLSQKGYATPKICVRAAVFKEGRILLVREILDGRWSMPGGWADLNDPPSKMVEREVREESGFSVIARKLISVHESNHNREPLEYWHSYTMTFLCELTGGTACNSMETTAVDFFAPDAIPPLSLARTNEKQIEEAYHFLNHPNETCIFD